MAKQYFKSNRATEEEYEAHKLREKLRLREKAKRDPLYFRVRTIRQATALSKSVFRKEPIDTQIEEAGRMPENVVWRIAVNISAKYRNRLYYLRQCSMNGKKPKYDEKLDKYLLQHKFINNKIEFA